MVAVLPVTAAHKACSYAEFRAVHACKSDKRPSEHWKKTALADELRPLLHLALAIDGTEDDTADRVALAIGTIRVKFAAIVTFWNVDLCEIPGTG